MHVLLAMPRWTKAIPTKEWLETEYIEQRRSAIDIGEELGVTSRTVFRWLKECSIPSNRTIPTKEWLENAYLFQNKTTSEIATEWGVHQSSVCAWLKKCGIPIRSKRDRRLPKGFILPSEEWIRDSYVAKRKSALVIAREIGVDHKTVLRWIKMHGIESRSISEARLPADFIVPTEEWFRNAYLVKRKSTIEIAKTLGVSHAAINVWLKRFGVVLRTVREAAKKGELNRCWKGGISGARKLLIPSYEWKNACRIVKKRDKGHCRLCASKGILTKGRDVHHIDMFVEALLLACDPGNLVLLCKPCHIKITGNEKRWKKRLFKIIGEPFDLSKISNMA